jgi:hypothetical protein
VVRHAGAARASDAEWVYRIARIVSNHIHHERVRDFLTYIFARGITTPYVSSLTWGNAAR